MTVSTLVSRQSYAGDGVSTVFNFAYYFLEEADLKVILKDDVTGVETVQVLTTNYTVIGEGIPAGGSVTMLVAPPLNTTLTIYRDPALVQEVDYVENDKQPAEVTEETIDRLTMIDQRSQNWIARTAKLSEGTPDGAFDPTLPEDLILNPDTVLAVNPTADGFVIGPTITDIADAAANAAAAAASAVASAASATASSGSAVASAASAAAAAAATASVFFRDVVFLTFADSPVTLTSAARGKLYSVDATGGNVAITLPDIAGLDLTSAFVLGFKKTDASANTVTLNRASTDLIDTATTKVLVVQNIGTIIVPDTDTAPDKWTSMDMGSSGSSGIISSIWDAVLGSGAQVAAGEATHSTWASMIAALTSGQSYKVLQGSWTENVTIDKQLHGEGNGYASQLNGNLTFASTASRSSLNLLQVTGDITLDSGVEFISLDDIHFGAGKTVVDNSENFTNFTGVAFQA